MGDCCHGNPPFIHSTQKQMFGTRLWLAFLCYLTNRLIFCTTCIEIHTLHEDIICNDKRVISEVCVWITKKKKGWEVTSWTNLALLCENKSSLCKVQVVSTVLHFEIHTRTKHSMMAGIWLNYYIQHLWRGKWLAISPIAAQVVNSCPMKAETEHWERLVDLPFGTVKTA